MSSSVLVEIIRNDKLLTQEQIEQVKDYQKSKNVNFERSLIEVGGELVYNKRFADHHRFTQQEVLNVINRSKKRQAAVIITTQKDAVRFPKLDRRDLPIYFMRVEIQIMRGARDFQECVRQICFR